jgi:predicted DNA-binding antitoxin AbrB/MazE fold protein
MQGEVYTMARTIEAVYENGVFKPLQPVELEEGQRVQVWLPTEPVKMTPEQVDEMTRELHESFAELTDEEWEEIKQSWKRGN